MSDIQPARLGRRRFGKLTIWSWMVLIAAAAVGFIAIGQLTSSEDNFRQQLASESEGDLARILASLSSESQAQQQELALLKVELANLQNSAAAQGTADAATQAQLNSLQVLSGTVPVSGPGLELEVQDPKHQVTYDVIVDAVQELRDAGAEAIAVNNQRVGVASSFTSSNGQIVLDNVALSSPYKISAIGPAATMEGGLEIPGGSLDTLRALNGVTTEVHRSTSLTLPALERPPSFQAARPAN